MKILHVIPTLSEGGAELMLERLIIHQLNRFEHVVVVFELEGEIERRLVQNRIKVHEIGLRKYLDLLGSFIRLAKIIRNEKPDVVQTWMYHADLIGGLAARFSGVSNILWSVRASEVRRGTGQSSGTIICRRLCALLSHFLPRLILYVAHSAKRRHISLGYSKKKVLVIPNGYDLDLYKLGPASGKSFRGTLEIPENAVLVGSIGSYNVYKNHIGFIQAADILRQRYENVYFLMAGRGVDEDNRDISSLLKSTDLKDRFRLIGFQRDLVPVYSALDIFCLHSISEGFPNVLAEAMSTQLPVVTTRAGDAEEIVGGTGIVVDTFCSERLAMAIGSVIDKDAAQRKNMGMLARSRIRHNYSLEAVSLLYSNLYEDIATR